MRVIIYISGFEINFQTAGCPVTYDFSYRYDIKHNVIDNLKGKSFREKLTYQGLLTNFPNIGPKLTIIAFEGYIIFGSTYKPLRK